MVGGCGPTPDPARQYPQPCYGSSEDFAAYAPWLREAAARFRVAIHARVFMTNHVHLLATPATEDGISRVMQHLGRRYVRYFNHVHRRTGTRWEGRFKACLVQDTVYLLHCYRYIELNPVCAGMVADPGGYRWSSYRVNALGVESDLCTPHEIYCALGEGDERLTAYRTLFAPHVDDDPVTHIREATRRGHALGDEHFIQELEARTRTRLRAGKPGPKGKQGGAIRM